MLTQQLLYAQFPEDIQRQLAAFYIEPQLMGYVMSQLVGNPADKVVVSRNFADLWTDKSFLTKTIIILRSLFLPKKLIAQMYGLPESSLRVWFYYLVRARDLWRRYGGSAREMTTGESPFSAGVEMDNALSEWLVTQ
jgi:hypothetical protein